MTGKLIIPMITPFRNNHLDRDALDAFMVYAAENGFSGLFAGSSTGGMASLSFEQHQEFLQWALELNHGLEMFAGITRSSLVETIEMGRIAADLGYGKIVAINPYYHKYSQDSIVRFYDSILDAFDLDVYAYNNPSLSGTEILPQTVSRIRKEHDNLKGIKDSGNNLDKFSEFLKIPGLTVYQGKDSLLLDSLKMGASGGVCSSANFCLNTLKIVQGSSDASSIQEKTVRLMGILARYETPGIQNYLFRKLIMKEKSPKHYVNMPFGDITEPPSDEQVLDLVLLK